MRGLTMSSVGLQMKTSERHSWLIAMLITILKIIRKMVTLAQPPEEQMDINWILTVLSWDLHPKRRISCWLIDLG